MNYLLDTHVILWWLTEPKKINVKARNIIADKSNALFVSSASFWEMAIKRNLGRLTLPRNIIEVLEQDSFQTLPITPVDAISVADLPLIHQDPFDRMLIVQAKLHNMILITRDKLVLKYPVNMLKA